MPLKERRRFACASSQKEERESVKKAREEEEEDCEYPRDDDDDDDRISACVGGRLVFRREEVGALRRERERERSEKFPISILERKRFFKRERAESVVVVVV